MPEPHPCFADSRRLTGHNRFFAGTGAVLEALGPTAEDAGAHRRWQASVSTLRRALGWPEAPARVRRHAGGTLLAIEAPADQLFTATEINEWAWERASGLFEPAAHRADESRFDQLHFPDGEIATVVAAFVARAAAEKNPALMALRAAARRHRISFLADDDDVSLGGGAGSRTWPLTGLPDAASIAWDCLHDIPTALVTGSNGKTTTVRLLAAMLDAGDPRFHNHVGYSSTEGVMIGGRPAGDGDFAGPAGARLVLRDPRVEAAVLETARGGLLRRGLAMDHADVAIVTNISEDHFGEYGIDSLDDLAEVKLVVARALGNEGTLVLNADDPVLLARVTRQACRVALFAADDAHPALAALRVTGGSTCGPAEEQLWLTHRGARTSLGHLRAMPLTVNGAAIYNVANISAAALAATAMGVSAGIVATVLGQFGSRREDNPGRLERWMLADITVLMDYAHNPHGIASLLSASRSIKEEQVRAGGAAGRIALLLGQAGNRGDEAIADLARTAAKFHPDLIVVKEIAGMLRGRELGEVTARLMESLLAAGYPPEHLHAETDEVEAACHLLRWARPGDVLVLPIHQSAARQALVALLDHLERSPWRAGLPLPAVNAVTAA